MWMAKQPEAMYNRESEERVRERERELTLSKVQRMERRRKWEREQEERLRDIRYAEKENTTGKEATEEEEATVLEGKGQYVMVKWFRRPRGPGKRFKRGTNS